VSRTADVLAAARRRLRGEGDEGFTLVEILVSLTVFAVVASAAAGMVITGLRTSLVSKLDTGAKNLAQERVEIMRNLPFHVPRDPAATTADNSDLLDIYYRNLTAAPNSTSTGYVAACGTQTAVCAGRAEWDPKNGSFYRYVIDPVPGHPKYRQYVATQFLDANRVPLSPGTYNSQVSGQDGGPSQFVGVTVTTYWTAGKLSKSFQVQTLISAGRPAASLVTLQARSTALKLTGGLDATRLLTLNAGVVNLDGALAVGASSAAQAYGAQGDITNTTHVDGAAVSVQAPPNAPASTGNSTAKTIMNDLTPVAYFGNTQSSGVGAAVTGGLPGVGSASSPVRAQVTSHGTGTTPVWFNPAPTPTAHLMLDSTRPLVWMEQSTGSVPMAESTGYLTSTGGATHSATASVAAKSLAVRMFPTTFAPNGVVQVTLSSAALNCATTGATGGGTVGLTYGATVAYWNGTGYTTVALDHGQTASPLDLVGLSTTQVGVDTFGMPIFLGDYVSSWSSATTGSIGAGKSIDSDANRVEASYDGLVKLTSVPMRPGDPTSTVGLLAGSLSCIAEDNR
jgi:prepilin-type N-terminal cleavage/methylation domain-containing protein